MPTYDYVCKKCHHRFEEVQPFSSEPVASCPKCRAKAARQFSVPVVVYKGSGFYTTDHGRGSAGSNGTARKSGDGDSTGKSDGLSVGKSGDGSSSSKSESASSSKSSEASSSSTPEKKEAAKVSSSSDSKI